MQTFGYNAQGQLGIGSDDWNPHPNPITINEEDWKKVACGWLTTFGIKSNGTLWGCGENGGGQLGLGHEQNEITTLQQEIGYDSDWAYVSGGQKHTLAIKTDGTLWGAGAREENYGQVGNNSVYGTTTFVQVGTDTWLKASAGYYHSLGIKSDGTLWSWGRNNYGQLGLGDLDSRYVPTLVSSEQWIDIAAGYNHSIAIKADGTIWGFGSNNSYELGVSDNSGDTGNYLVPTQEFTQGSWERVFAHGRFTAAIKPDGSIWGWGLMPSGDSYYTAQLIDGGQWKTVSCGEMHLLGIKQDDTLYSYGANMMGQLGLGDTNDRAMLTQVSTEQYKLVGGGRWHSIVVQGTSEEHHEGGSDVSLTVSVVSDGYKSSSGGSEVTFYCSTSGSGELYVGYENFRLVLQLVGADTNPTKYECGAFYTYNVVVSIYNPDTGEYESKDFEITDCYLESWDDESVTQLYDCYIDGTQIGFNAPDYPGTYYLVLCIKCQYLPGLDRAKVRTGLAVGE